MTKQKIQTLKGFRDFLPKDKRKRDAIEAKIKQTFERFGFEPLETPTLEYASLLLGKYGEEADSQVYSFKDRGGRKIALRYDQTVPTARVLAQYQSQLPRFFRRYQIDSAYRTENPQAGRYRQFKQCDADIFGTTSPLADAEILAVYYTIYQDLGLDSLVIEINDRETLMETLSPFATTKVNVFSLIQSIDKLDKIGIEGVTKELTKKNLVKAKAKNALEKIQQATPSKNLKTIMDYTKALGVPAKALKFNPTLARGLDYYTGMIFEGKVKGSKGGSVGGGGRYDNLIEQLGGPNTPAVGFGLGFDRTVQAAEELSKVKEIAPNSQVLVTIFGAEFLLNSLTTIKKLRAQNINAELYPEPSDNLGKQLSYANKLSIPYVVIIGEEEAKEGKIKLKNMQSGEQKTLPLDQAIDLLRS